MARIGLAARPQETTAAGTACSLPPLGAPYVPDPTARRVAMVRAIVTDPLAPEGLALIEAAGHDVATFPEPDAARQAGALADAELWVVRSGTTVTAADLDAASQLRAIARAGVGVDNVDLEAATARGVAVFNAPTGNITSAAEQAWALMLSAARRTPEGDAAMKQEDWARKRLKGVELAGKTLFVVGLGRIGRMMAARAQAFEMTVTGYDPFVTPEAARGFGVEWLEIDDALPQADVVSLHTPLLPHTRHTLDERRLALVKKGAIIVNAARGGLIDEEALLASLESGHVHAAGIDVWEEEPPTDWRLAKHARVVAAPHLGASTSEAQVKAATQAVGRALDFLASGDAGLAVNAQASLDGAAKPWALLAERLSGFATQCLPQTMDRLTVATTEGLPQEAICTHALVGAVRATTDDAVNAINAPSMAKQRGWSVATQNLPEDSPGFIRITAEGGGHSVTLEGTHTPHYGSRVTSLDNYDVEFRPQGRFLMTRHRDVPGVLARLLAPLAGAGVNVANVSLARHQSDGSAVAVIRVDGGIPREARDGLRGLDDVFEAHRIRL